MNDTRETYLTKLKAGNIFPKAKAALQILKEAGKPLNMKEITKEMKPWGFDIKSHYDLFNAMTDAGLVKKDIVNGIELFMLK